MKTLIALIVLTISVNVFAIDIDFTLGTLALTVVGELIDSTADASLERRLEKERGKINANKIIKESNEYESTGITGPTLSEGIRELQALDSTLSVEEAKDSLIEASYKILK